MDMTGLQKAIKSVQMTTRKYQPEILTGIGIAGVISTTVMAVKATPKALDVLDEVRENHKRDTDRKEYSKDVIKQVVPIYIPSAILGSLSIACLVGASSVNYRRNAALATAYTLSENTLREYQAKVIETFGEKKNQVIHDAIAKDRVDQNPADSQQIIFTGKGETRCYDMISDRYFYSDIEKIRRAENELNHRLYVDNYISMNEYFEELGLKGTGPGYELGWNIDRGYLEFKISAILPEDGIPTICISHARPPYHEYR